METAGHKLKIYCETSFWSYLVGGPTSDEKVARWQALTRKWWEEVAPKCEIFISQHVFDEAQQGNRMMASARMRLITLPKTAMIIGKAGYSCPVIVTPEEFLARREEFGL